MRNFLIVLLAIFGLYGCQDNVDANAITGGTSYTKAQYQAMDNVDLHSYAEVADVFLETHSIQSNGKPYFLVFSANGCVYCDRLKNLIRDNADVKAFLKDNYAPYYINISYSKTHKVEFMDKSITTMDLAQKYGIKPTPTLIFLSSNGKELFSYPGFMPKDKFMRALEFFKDSTLEQKDAQTIKQEFQKYLES